MLLLCACEKNDEIVTLNKQNESVNDFAVDDGYLHFTSISSFKTITSKIANLDDTAREQWENQIGFRSQRRIVSEIINDELQIDSINQIRYTGASIQDIPESELYSDSYKYYLSKGVIKVINKGTENEYWDYSVFSRSFIEYINEDGLFAIGDTIFRVTDSELLALTDGDFSNKELLFKVKNRIVTG